MPEPRRVVVTGGGSGVGRAIARAFAAAGDRVTVAGRRRDLLEETAAGFAGIACVEADVTDEASVAALFAAAGPTDVVVANAGIGKSAPIGKTTLQLWENTLSTNLTGAFLTFRAGLREMPEDGRLIAVSSILGLVGGPYVSAYAASKHGLIGLVRSLAKELAPRRITANAICPGYVDTPMTDRTIANIAAQTGRGLEAARAHLERVSPAGRLVTVEEVAAAASYLASPGAAFVSGHALTLSGGDP